MKFPVWRIKTNQFWSKKEEVMTRVHSSEVSPDALFSMADSAHDALMMVLIYAFGAQCGNHGFTEEELQNELDKAKNYNDLTLLGIRWIATAVENRE